MFNYVLQAELLTADLTLGAFPQQWWSDPFFVAREFAEIHGFNSVSSRGQPSLFSILESPGCGGARVDHPPARGVKASSCAPHHEYTIHTRGPS